MKLQQVPIYFKKSLKYRCKTTVEEK